MAHRGFTDARGTRVPFAEIDPIKDWARFNCSPATLYMLIQSAQSRAGLPDGITASQAGSEVRQMFLRDTQDYYPTTDAAISGYSGTLKHQQINVDNSGLIVEERFVSKKNPRISAQIDHAAVVAYEEETRTLWVDLWDLKTAKWYAVTKLVKDVWGDGGVYAWQLNLCATLLEEVENFDAYQVMMLFQPVEEMYPRFPSVERISVHNLYLECVPADASYNNAEEAKKLGVDFRKVIVPVTRRPADWVYSYYEDLLEKKDAAKAEGYAPLCKERWSNRKIQDLRCKFYCDVSAECKAFSLAHGEWHPLADESELLAASLEAKS